MDVRSKYREESGKDIFSATSGQYPYLSGTGTYSDEYVLWLEKQTENTEEYCNCESPCEDILTGDFCHKCCLTIKN